MEIFRENRSKGFQKDKKQRRGKTADLQLKELRKYSVNTV